MKEISQNPFCGYLKRETKGNHLEDGGHGENVEEGKQRTKIYNEDT